MNFIGKIENSDQHQKDRYEYSPLVSQSSQGQTWQGQGICWKWKMNSLSRGLSLPIVDSSFEASEQATKICHWYGKHIFLLISMACTYLLEISGETWGLWGITELIKVSAKV